MTLKHLFLASALSLGMYAENTTNIIPERKEIDSSYHYTYRKALLSPGNVGVGTGYRSTNLETLRGTDASVNVEVSPVATLAGIPITTVTGRLAALRFSDAENLSYTGLALSGGGAYVPTDTVVPYADLQLLWGQDSGENSYSELSVSGLGVALIAVGAPGWIGGKNALETGIGSFLTVQGAAQLVTYSVTF